MPGHATEAILVSVIECFLFIRNNNVYGLGVGI